MDLTAVQAAITSAISDGTTIGQAVLVGVATLVVVGLGIALIKKL